MLALQGWPGVIGTPVLRGQAPAPRRSPQAGRWKELPAPEGPGGILWALNVKSLCVWSGRTSSKSARNWG